MRIDGAKTTLRGALPGPMRAHPFVVALLLAALLGGGLRFIPTSQAALPGTSGTHGVPSTACSAS